MVRGGPMYFMTDPLYRMAPSFHTACCKILQAPGKSEWACSLMPNHAGLCVGVRYHHRGLTDPAQEFMLDGRYISCWEVFCAAYPATSKLIQENTAKHMDNSPRTTVYDSGSPPTPMPPAEEEISPPVPSYPPVDRAVADRAYRFLCGLNLQDQPINIQKEQREIVHALGNKLNPARASR